MYKLTENQCLNCLNGFVCSERKAYQNYPCPYQNLNKCPQYIPITKEMIEQWEKTGCICIKL